ncbi:MAG TPA: hypothetical protein VNO52_09535 [Methylomirabilota bacterium]|nr:hypothetical protein [Methylomirabilota bacterium]
MNLGRAQKDFPRAEKRHAEKLCSDELYDRYKDQRDALEIEVEPTWRAPPWRLKSGSWSRSPCPKTSIGLPASLWS